MRTLRELEMLTPVRRGWSDHMRCTHLSSHLCISCLEEFLHLGMARRAPRLQRAPAVGVIVWHHNLVRADEPEVHANEDVHRRLGVGHSAISETEAPVRVANLVSEILKRMYRNTCDYNHNCDLIVYVIMQD